MVAKKAGKRAAKAGAAEGGTAARDVPIDLHRAIVFPNRMREQRRKAGYAKLLPFAATIPDIPYIRLSKIERGEVVARVDELRRIAGALGVAADALLIDIDAPDFDVARWAEPFGDGAPPDMDEERFAVLLGAALKARRTRDGALTIAVLERDFGLAPVNLSRVENAFKPWSRWSAATQRALLTVLGASDEQALRDRVESELAEGALDEFLPAVANPEARNDRTRARIAELAEALEGPARAPAPRRTPPAGFAPRRLAVTGAPLAGGLIADTATGEHVEAPAQAGPRAFALRVSRATLGGGMPAQSVVVADPDRFPAPGGLAVLREDAGWRLLAVGADRDGRMMGYSSNPEHEAVLDDCDPARLAAVTAAYFV